MELIFMNGKKIAHSNYYLEKKITEDKIYPSSLKNYKLFERQEIPDSVKTINETSNHCIWVASFFSFTY